jgi:hypothetical protein
MKRAALLVIALTMILAIPTHQTVATDSQTLMGTYIWGAVGTESDLEAIFSPTGDERWTVDFHFNFRGQDHTYSGTAEGSLTEGALQGTVKNDSKRRTFTFEGSFSEGVFTGTHAEVEDGKAIDTGTMALSP